MTAWGTLFAPIAHTWYNGLDKFFVGKGAMTVASKVAADQLVFTVRVTAGPALDCVLAYFLPRAAADQLPLLLRDDGDGDRQPGARRRPDL